MRALIPAIIFFYLCQGGLAQPSQTIKDRFDVPKDFSRVDLNADSFGAYLRHLKLKPEGSVVRYYNGKTKERPDVYCAVVDIEVGKRDLLQCADAVMLLYGEYLYHHKKYDQIAFNFLSDGQPRYFKDYTSDRSYEGFRKYMDYVFAYANTRSLHQQLIQQDGIYKMQVGDVFIQTGNPYGHAVIVVDMAENISTGERIYMLAQSYMPAQEIQILVNPVDSKLSPWYTLNNATIYTPEWTFEPGDLKCY